jgi:hypothetical protein
MDRRELALRTAALKAKTDRLCMRARGYRPGSKALAKLCQEIVICASELWRDIEGEGRSQEERPVC